MTTPSIHIDRPLERAVILQRNTTPSPAFRLADSNGVDIDLSGSSFECLIKVSELAADDDALFAWPVTITSAATGAFELDRLTVEQVNDVALFPDKGFFTLTYIDADGKRRRLLKGPLVMEP